MKVKVEYCQKVNIPFYKPDVCTFMYVQRNILHQLKEAMQLRRTRKLASFEYFLVKTIVQLTEIKRVRPKPKLRPKV